jgi:hypothetical protein
MTDKIPESVKTGFIQTLDTLFYLIEQEQYDVALKFIAEFEDVITQFKKTVKGLQDLERKGSE